MEILIITGACGVGKTTTASEWAKLKKGAIIECDYFTEWIFKPDFPSWGIEEEKLVATLATKTAIEYMQNGMPVAIENVWTPTGIQILIENLQKEKAVHFIKVIWLFCERKENHRRDELRIPDNQMKERVDIVNEELFGYTWQEYVHKIDSSNYSVGEIIQIIENLSIV